MKFDLFIETENDILDVDTNVELSEISNIVTKYLETMDEDFEYERILVVPA